MTSIVLSLAFLFGLILLIFSFIKRLIKKTKYFKERKKATNIVSVLLSFTLYFILSISLMLYITKIPQRKFDKSIWINKISERHKMIDDLIQSDYLIGKEKDSLEIIFGKPLKSDAENKIIEYELIGRTWADFRIVKLKLFLKNDLVSRFEYSEQK
tara:strand:+ start:3989 stop:4456 length:468 start_codon:yes stop_codon:yes gene_type:complete